MWHFIDGTVERRSIFNIQKSQKASVVQWSKASAANRPALVFIPGFLSETSHQNDMDEWTSNIIKMADMYDFASYGLYWPSGQLWELLMGKSLSTTLSAFSISGALVVPFIFNPVLLAGSLGISGAMLWNVIDIWKKAVSKADEVGRNSHQWLRLIDRPIILIGHSLGGRIVLKATSNVRKHNILQFYSLAPAVLEHECNFNKVCSGIQEKSAVFYSKNDIILNYFFRFVEMTMTQSLGYTGITKKKNLRRIMSVNTSEVNGEPVRHRDYRRFISDILLDRRLDTHLCDLS